MVMVQIVIFLAVSTFRYTQANYDVYQGFCPPQTTVNFPIDTREPAYSIPINRTRVGDNARQGCVCGVKPCLAICPLLGETDPGRSYVIDDYANYSMLPRVRATNGTFAVSLDPRERFDIFVWRPCPEYLMFSLEPSANELDEFYLLSNGSLFLPGRDGNSSDPFIRGFEEYCLLLNPGEGTCTPRVCYSVVEVADDGTEVEEEEEEEDEEEEKDEERDVDSTDIDKIQFIGGIVAVPFIAVTVFVYSVLPEFRNIHGTTLRCYLCCLAVLNVALAVDRLSTTEFVASTCLCLGFFIYFSFIASFSWLNVICFDLWRRFGGLSFMGISDFHNERKKFLWYSIYVWSISILMTAICIAMELAPGIPELSRPGFNATSCWFSEAAAPFYMYGPAGLSICCNICLFVLTSMKLCQHEINMRRDFGDSRDSECHNHNKTWFGVYLKLFVVMGVSWSTETITSFWQWPDYLGFVTDMVNLLQGFFIFLILVCKKSVWLSLKKQYGKQELQGTNDRRFNYILSPPSNEASRVVRNIPENSFSNTTSQLTIEENLN